MSIAGSGFSFCTNLTDVSFPAVTSIGNAAFYNCTNLTDVSFPAVTSIGDTAFLNCTNLTTVSFPLVTIIGNEAFRICPYLTSVTILVTTPPTLGSNVFPNSTNLQIFVPADSVEVYKTATGWSTYANRIVAIEE
jgi:hypothetical protein